MPAADSTHQTISYLTRRFREVGIRPRKPHGQNFLVDANLLRLIVERAELTSHDVVLEIGTGTGALTALVAPHVAAVVTVELDWRLYQLAREELVAHANVTMLNQDALHNKSHLDERLIEAVRTQLDQGAPRRFKLVANLPYNIATPVIANLLASPIVPYSMTVTVQKELADRICARPGTKDYGALAVWVQSQCTVELVRTLPPGVFWPKPQVTSAIVHVAVVPELRARIRDLAFFHDFARGLFMHRRKFLRGALAGAWKDRLDKPAIDRVLAEAGVDPECRADELDVETILKLSEFFQKTSAAAPKD